jgi:transglutaminase-like putative cysteine protease
MHPSKIVPALFSAFVLTSPAVAQTAKQRISYDLQMAEDRSTTYTKHIETTPLNDAAVQNFAQHRLTVGTRQTFEILEAFTRKADGRVVPVDQSQIATQDGVIGPFITLLDIKVKQIPFRDLSAGDTWVLTYRISEKDHYVPGQFSWSQLMPPSPVELDLDFKMRAPKAIAIAHAEKDLTYEESQDGEWTSRHWSGKIPHRTLTERNIANYVTFIPSLQFSTFRAYDDIGATFYEGAKPKLSITPAIQKLADEITAGRDGAQAQSEAIFDWVSKNVTYVAVFFGSGRFVPNDTETIIQRRFGDCKDHATLMIALLAAKGIDAEYALISSAGGHDLYAVPVVEAFDHVIVYVPSLGLYADPTSPVTTIRHLPNILRDKAVLRMSNNGVKLDRTPSGLAQENTATVEIKMTLDRNGKPRAESVMEATGSEAQILREFVHRSESTGQEAQMQAILKALRLTGELTMSAPPSYDHSEPYRVRLIWNGDKPLKLSEQNWNGAWGLTLLPAEPVRLFGALETAPRIYPAECRPGRVTMKLAMELPKGVFLRPVPDRYTEKTAVYSYSREWSFSGSTLKMNTELVSSVPNRVCGTEVIKAIVSVREKGKANRNPPLRLMKTTQVPASAQIDRLLHGNPSSGRPYFGH